MIYQYVKRYLKESFKEADIDFEWRDLDSIKFTTFLKKRFLEDEITKETPEIKEAFKDFFEPLGTIVFRYSLDNGVKIKLFPYRVEPKDSKLLPAIVTIVKRNKRYIEPDYKGQENQIGILGKIRREINSKLFDTKESVNKKELIKYAIHKALDLSDNDIVVLFKRTYIVKINGKEDTSEVNVENMKDSKSTTGRYNGYSKEQLEDIRKEVFTKISEDEFIETVMEKVFKEYIDFTSISNKEYEENAVKGVFKEITDELNSHMSQDADYVQGFAGYFMREKFYEVHEHIATNLLNAIHEKSPNAEKFLLYYNGKIIIENGKRYQIPSLATKDGQQWNNSGILGICSLWINTKNKKKTLEQKRKLAQREIEKAKKVLSPGDDRKNALKKENIGLEDDIIEQQALIATEASKLKIMEAEDATVEDVEKIEAEIAELTEKLGEIEEQEAVNRAEISSINSDNRELYEHCRFNEQNFTKFSQEIQRYDNNIDSNSSTVNGVISSLVTALMSRKKLINI